MAQKIVVLDPGHGGNDPGAIGNNLKEKDINLSVTRMIKTHLDRCGVKVLVTRDVDKALTLNERVAYANKNKADCFVSVHCNSAEDKSGQGMETFCYKFSSRELSDYIHKRVLSTGTYTKDRKVKEGNFYVIRETTMKASLIELAFISNTADSKLLKEKQPQFAQAIAQGICDYLKIAWVPQTSNTKKTLYQVVTGSYTERVNAERMLNELKSKGYSPFIELEEREV